MSTLKLYRSFGLPSPKQEVEFGLQILASGYIYNNTNSVHIPHIAHSDEYYVMVQKGLIFAGQRSVSNGTFSQQLLVLNHLTTVGDKHRYQSST